MTKSKALTETERQATKEVSERFGIAVKPAKPQKQKSGKTSKPPSFAEIEQIKITANLPKILVRKLRVIAALNDHRFNIELAAAIDYYVQKNSKKLSASA